MDKLKKTNKSGSLHDSTNKAFYTDIKQPCKQQLDLKNYVNNIENKINYAKWKQQLVLKYNYMPMKRITEKVENEKQNYVKKIKQQQKACARILSGEQLTVQLQLFREFSNKLKQKMQEIQNKIQQQKLKNRILLEDVAEKKKRLKQKMKQNMNIIRENLEKQGIKSKNDIIRLVRSQSTKDRLTKGYGQYDSFQKTQRKQSQLTTAKTHRYQMVKTTTMLYQQCLRKIIQQIQSMKTSEDIQSGIYLDVMDKKQYSTQNRYSMKSKISDILHSKFGISQRKKQKSNLQKANFQMDWETFKQLNWKQMMGIILVKDPNCSKINKLLNFY